MCSAAVSPAAMAEKKPAPKSGEEGAVRQRLAQLAQRGPQAERAARRWLPQVAECRECVPPAETRIASVMMTAAASP